MTRRHWLAAGLLWAGLALAETDSETERMQFADGLYTRQMYQLAAVEYESFLKAFPKPANEDTVRFRLGECYRQTGKLVEAEKQFRHVFVSFPKSAFRLKAGFKRADVFLQAGRHDEAIDLYQVVLSAKPPKDIAAACLYFSAEARMKMKMPEKALPLFDAVRAKHADSKFFAFAALKLGELYARGKGTPKNKKDEAKALALFEQVAARPASPRTGAEALFQIAELHFLKKDYERSHKAYAKLLEKYPKDQRREEALLQAAWASHNAGRYADALALVDEAIKALATPAGPKGQSVLPEWLYLKANCERQLTKYAQALASYSRLLANHPTSSFVTSARYERALTYYRTGDFQRAVAEAKHLQVDGNMKKDVYWLLAESYAGLKQNAEAIQYYRLLVRDFPDSEVSGDARYRLAHHLQGRKEYKEASRYYQGLAKAFPKSKLAPRALFASAYCLSKEDLTEEAVRDWSLLIERYPKDRLVEESLYQKAMGDTRLKRGSEAMTSLRALIKQYPKSSFLADAHYWHGMHLAEAAKYADAEQAFRKALLPKPRLELDREIRYALATVLEKNGKTDEAIGLFHTLLTTPARSKFTPALLEWLAVSQIERKKLNEAEAAARALLESGKDAGWLQTGWCLVGRTLVGTKPAEAADAFKNALKQDVTTAYAGEAALRLGELLLKDGKHVEAGASFKQAVGFATRDEQRGVRARAYMGLARSVKKGASFDEAARYFMTVAVLYDDAELVPESLYEAAHAFKKLGRGEECRQAVGELVQRYPTSPWVKRAKTDLAVEAP